MKNHKGEDYVTMEDFNQIGKDRDNLKYMPRSEITSTDKFL